MTNISKTWVTGETIKADDLNKISPHFIEVTVDYDNSTMTTEKTAGEINELLVGGNYCVLYYTTEYDEIYYLYPLGTVYDDRFMVWTLLTARYNLGEVQVIDFTASSVDSAYVYNFGGSGG